MPQPSPRIIIGIDPGLVHTGYGIIAVSGNALRFIKSGTISPPAKAATAQRLAFLAGELTLALEAHRPHTAIIEESFMANNANSALKLGMARGVALLTAAQAGCVCVELAARVVKKSLTGTGAADKKQIGFMVKQLLPQSTADSEHAADALALAIAGSQLPVNS